MSLRIRSSRYLMPGQIALERNGEIVWVGRLGDPVEDAEFTILIVSEADYDDIKRKIPAR